MFIYLICLPFELPKVVARSWQLFQGYNVVNKLAGYAQSLESWSRRIKTHFKEDIEKCRRDLESL